MQYKRLETLMTVESKQVVSGCIVQRLFKKIRSSEFTLEENENRGHSSAIDKGFSGSRSSHNCSRACRGARYKHWNKFCTSEPNWRVQGA